MSETTNAQAVEQSWVDSIPEDIRGSVDKFKTPEELAKSYVNLEKRMGNSIFLPEERTPEAMADVWNKLGRPESPDQYEIKVDSDVPLDDGLLEQFKQYGHRLGLANDQLNEVVKFQIDAVSNAMAAEMEASEEKLKEAWGDKKDANAQKAIEAAKKLGLDEVFLAKGLDRDADVIKAMYKLSNAMGEGAIKQGETDVPKTKEQKIKELQEHPAFTKRTHPEHKQIHAEWVQLMTNKG